MLNNGNKQTCGFADEILSYIYDEIGNADRGKFETHLADCSVCTDEFAAVSHARFSVFEWQKEEFAHLATPEIVIPYAPKRIVSDEAASAGLLAGISGWLTLIKLPVALAAGLIAFLGIGILTMTYFSRSSEHTTATNVSTQPAVSHDPSVVVPPKETKPPEASVATVLTKPTRQEVRPVKVVEHRRPRIERQITADNLPVRDRAPQPRKAPVLTAEDDNDDHSLRLADLFDSEVGAKL